MLNLPDTSELVVSDAGEVLARTLAMGAVKHRRGREVELERERVGQPHSVVH